MIPYSDADWLVFDLIQCTTLKIVGIIAYGAPSHISVRTRDILVAVFPAHTLGQRVFGYEVIRVETSTEIKAQCMRFKLLKLPERCITYRARYYTMSSESFQIIFGFFREKVRISKLKPAKHFDGFSFEILSSRLFLSCFCL